jgi:hypothetical protein
MRASTDDRSTVPGGASESQQKRGAYGRAAFAAGVLAFLVAVMFGAAGPTTTDATTEGGGFELAVHHTERTRAGLAAPWEATVGRTDGQPIDGEITLAVSTDYVALFDENGLDPEPEHATTDDTMTYWTFEPPSQGSLVVSFDARVEPGIHRPQTGEVQLLVDDEVVATVEIDTLVVP